MLLLYKMNTFINLFPLIEGMTLEEKREKHKHKHKHEGKKINKSWTEKNREFAVGDFNRLMEHAKKRINCDSTCQREKKIKHLKHKYLESKEWEQTAPEKTRSSFEKYYVYAFGRVPYEEVMEKKLSHQADHKIKLFMEEFEKEVEGVEGDIVQLASSFEIIKNLVEYRDKLKEENNYLKKRTTETKADIITNDRKSYYEDQGIQQLDFYYMIISYFYYAILFGFLVSIFLVDKQTPIMQKKQKFVVFLLFFVYPYIIMHIVKYIYGNIKKIHNYLPGNAYRDIEPTETGDNNRINTKN